MRNSNSVGRDSWLSGDRPLWILGLFVVIPVGLSTKFMQGSGPLFEWWRDSAGDFLYQIALMLVMLVIRPKLPIVPLAWGTFFYSSIIEFTQLIRTPWLDALRLTIFGRLVLGSTFVWDDFIYYFLGSWLGCWLIAEVKRMKRNWIFNRE
jgi:hypothetical protein